eukprot:CAMPEP_0184695346 /NCGR_PEP_ID=MMETSP0313-20130426/3006_1 /TAXON_ID=2792 /ORGANISM="Porphyridium aerugineum, Strain SAG 1380-2" /LENGTH=518 /DNA_ID=CAMNT_0027153781 /DNA_START=133 /DNA_END=1689 /DNA_ORIENTATION=+
MNTLGLNKYSSLASIWRRSNRSPWANAGNYAWPSMMRVHTSRTESQQHQQHQQHLQNVANEEGHPMADGPLSKTTSKAQHPKEIASLGLDFTNYHVFYGDLKRKDLLRALLVLKSCQYKFVSHQGPKLFHLLQKTPLRGLVNYVVKKTYYNHFVGGKDVAECKARLQRLTARGVIPILDYSVEFLDTDVDHDVHNMNALEAKYDGTADVIMGTILDSGSMGLKSFACVKVSGIGRFQLLEKVTSIVENNESSSWSDSIDLNFIHKKLAEENPHLSVEFQSLLARLDKLCSASKAHNIPILIDAEHHQIQSAIDAMAMEMMSRYNTKDKAIVYNTIQAYKKRAFQNFEKSLQFTSERGIKLGIKQVRGAYLSHERERAKQLGIESPVFDSLAETHKSYDDIAQGMIDQIALGRAAALFATHNAQSLEKACQHAVIHRQLASNTPDLVFGQLFGMGDSLTLALTHAGFNCAKYVPFGPMLYVMPYITRRLEENRDILGGAPREVGLFLKELKSRDLIPRF